MGRILLGGNDDNAAKGPSWRPETVSRVLIGVGLVLALVTSTDFILAIYPPGFGNPEWEISIISEIIGGLPLLTIGLVGIWAGFGQQGQRLGLIACGAAFLLLALAVLGGLVLFLTDAPMALNATQDVAHLGIQKLVAKTVTLGLLFCVLYIVAGVAAMKQSRRTGISQGAG